MNVSLQDEPLQIELLGGFHATRGADLESHLDTPRLQALFRLRRPLLRHSGRRGRYPATRLRRQPPWMRTDRVRAIYRDNYDRLARIKATHDPDNRFCMIQNIEPAACRHAHYRLIATRLDPVAIGHNPAGFTDQ